MVKLPDDWCAEVVHGRSVEEMACLSCGRRTRGISEGLGSRIIIVVVLRVGRGMAAKLEGGPEGVGHANRRSTDVHLIVEM